jgi:serine-type D-Ala-D-Ala carboxypeptidase/endopeptidase (penicillin-binding protein 4)
MQDKMKRFNPKPGRIGKLATLMTVTLAISLANLSRASAVVSLASTSRGDYPANSLEPAFCPVQLEASIASIIDRSSFDTAQWGIAIEPVSEPTVLYQYNSDAFLIPASNIKLLTTAAALRIVGDRPLQDQASFESWITTINQESDNDLADDLLRRIGGQFAVRSALALVGIDPDSYEQVDGSGLSRSNRAKPSTFVTLLREMYAQDGSGLFYQSLPIAGVNGTLQNRFRNTAVEGRVHAKTGTLQGVRALSGYLENDSYGTIAFSIVVNQPGQSGQIMTEAIDQIVLQTAQVNRCD